MAKFWLHCYHLYVNGEKMSKSKGSIYYIDTLLKEGYGAGEIRFFLIYNRYRKKLNYSHERMNLAAGKLKKFKKMVSDIEAVAGQCEDSDRKTFQRIKKIFVDKMDNDLNVKEAFDGLHKFLSEVDVVNLKPAIATSIVKAIKNIDEVLKVIF